MTEVPGPGADHPVYGRPTLSELIAAVRESLADAAAGKAPVPSGYGARVAANALAIAERELVHRGDPLEDLGWFCVRAWRFGEDARPAAGLGSIEDFVASYERAGGGHVDRDALRWWQVLGTLRWGVICQRQANRHLSGQTRSVELAAIGRRVCENEWDLLELLAEQGLSA